MNKHQVIFERIKAVLKQHFHDELDEYEDGSYLSIGDSGIWISSDSQELTVGFDSVHTHYDPNYDNIEIAVELFFNLLTKRRRITNYQKGNFVFRSKKEIELNEEEFELLGSSMTLFFPFWKRTTEHVSFEKPLINRSKLKHEIAELLNYAQLYL